jgi:hypothetical protein
MEFVDILQELSKRVRSKFYRFILYDEGRVEVEFEASNPWECLVIKYENWKALLESLERNPYDRMLPNEIVIRKKCTKCFLHERKPEPTVWFQMIAQ